MYSLVGHIGQYCAPLRQSSEWLFWTSHTIIMFIVKSIIHNYFSSGHTTQ